MSSHYLYYNYLRSDSAFLVANKDLHSNAPFALVSSHQQSENCIANLQWNTLKIFMQMWKSARASLFSILKASVIAQGQKTTKSLIRRSNLGSWRVSEIRKAKIIASLHSTL